MRHPQYCQKKKKEEFSEGARPSQPFVVLTRMLTGMTAEKWMVPAVHALHIFTYPYR
jgi:hypothetical protein